MERYCELNEISDGKLYKSKDMVKIGSNDCKGCSQCCRTVGDSILLDPYDIYALTNHLGTTMQILLQEKLELRVVDGLILPNIRTENEQGGCGFLDEAGRCTIHSARPGFCRMFPLGRYYEDGGFQYILQVHECPYPYKTEVQIEKWLGIADLERYEKYICDWHYFILHLQHRIKEGVEDTLIKQINMYILQIFFFLPYEDGEDFYTQFYRRLTKAMDEIEL